MLLPFLTLLRSKSGTGSVFQPHAKVINLKWYQKVLKRKISFPIFETKRFLLYSNIRLDL